MSVTSDNIAANQAAIENLQAVQSATLGVLSAQAQQIAALQASQGGASQADLDAANAQLTSGTSAINAAAAGLPQPAPVVAPPAAS